MKEAVEKIIESTGRQCRCGGGRRDRREGRPARRPRRADDYGRVIGREGRTIKAIRNLLFIAGQKHGKRYQLDLLED